MQGTLIRHVVERLATLARTRGDGLGPFTRDDLSRVFTDVAGLSPQLGSDVILLRLPGIGNHSEDDGTRSFIDEDLADVARAGDVTRFILDPFAASLSYVAGVQSSLGGLGARVTATQLNRMGLKKGGLLRTALERANSLGTGESSSLPVDVFLVAQAQEQDLGTGTAVVYGADCEVLDFFDSTTDYSNVRFQDCVVSRLILAESNSDALPTFSSCFVGTLEGRTSAKDLPKEKFLNTEIEDFVESTGTQAMIMDTNLAPRMRVLLSILRKLFLQAGKGRLESALFRGLDHRVRDFVPEVLKLVEAEGFATQQSFGGKSVWTPARKNSGRARAILASPHSSTDSLTLKSKAAS